MIDKSFDLDVATEDTRERGEWVTSRVTVGRELEMTMREKENSSWKKKMPP